MKKSVIIFVFVLGVILFVYAVLNVTLTSPENNYRNITGEFNLTCSVTDDTGIVNVTLYHNFTGTWHANSTIDLTGTSNSTSWNFSNVNSGTYIWNCLSYNSSGQSSWSSLNQTLISGGYLTWNASQVTGDIEPTSNSGGEYTFRTIIHFGNTSVNGNETRIKFPGSTSDEASIINATFGERNGATWNLLPGFVNLTFSGSNNYTMSTSESYVWSDWINFNFSSNKSYLVSVYTGSNSSADGFAYYVGSNEAKTCFKSGDYTDDLTYGSCTSSTNIYGVSEVEVYGAYPFIITINSPADNYILSSGIIPINYTLEKVSEHNVTNCSVYSNKTGTWELDSTNNVVEGENRVEIISIPNNISLKWGLKCSGDQEYWTSNQTINVSYAHVTYGDSITEGYGATTGPTCTSNCLDWSYLLSNISNLNLREINSGDSGSRLNDTGVNYVQTRIVDYYPKAVFIQYGLNDFRYGVTEKDFENAYNYVVKKILNSTNATLILGTTSHMISYDITGDGYPEWSKGNRTIHGKFNNIIQEIAVENNLSVSQIYYEFGYSGNLLDSDGIHPNNAGHAVLVRVHNQTYWANDTQSSDKWDVYSSVANFTFQNYTFNMSQHPHETNTTFIIEDMQLYNFSVNTTQAVQINTSNRYNSGTQYNLRKTSLNGGSYSTSVITSDNSGRLQFTIPVGNYTYNISLYVAPTSLTPSRQSESPSSTFYVSKQGLENGYSRKFRKNSKIKFEFNEEDKIVKVKEVFKEKVEVEIDNKSYSVNVNETGKIDLDKDGYYDLQVSVLSSDGTRADMEFKLIYEEVPAEEQEEQKSSVGEIQSSKIKWYYYVIAGIVVLLVAGLIVKRKFRKK